MKTILIVLAVAVVALTSPEKVAAQHPRGFVSVGTCSDVNGQRFPSVGGGVLVDLGRDWVSAGAAGEMFFSDGYVAGRGALLAQLNVVRQRAVRVFALGGLGWGEEAGPMIGAGLEWQFAGRTGIRLTIEDYLVRVSGLDCASLGYSPSYCEAELHDGQPWTGHQPTVRVAFVWR